MNKKIIFILNKFKKPIDLVFFYFNTGFNNIFDIQKNRYTQINHLKKYFSINFKNYFAFIF